MRFALLLPLLITCREVRTPSWDCVRYDGPRYVCQSAWERDDAGNAGARVVFVPSDEPEEDPE